MNNSQNPNEFRDYTAPSGSEEQPEQSENHYFDHTEAYRSAPDYGGNRPEDVPNTLGVVSFILGLIGFWFCSGCCPPLSIVAIVLACLDRKKAGRFRGMAIAGLVFGIIGLIATVIFGAFFVILLVLGMAETETALIVLQLLI